MLHRIEIADRFKGHVRRIDIGGLVVTADAPTMIETEQITLELLLSPQLAIDGASFEQRLGHPEPVPAGPMATQTLGVGPSGAATIIKAPAPQR